MSMILFDSKEPEKSLLKLVSSFESDPRSLEDIPSSFLNYFGPVVLARSLDVKLPSLPNLHYSTIQSYMALRQFVDLGSLIQAIKTFKTDIEKFYALLVFSSLRLELIEESLLQQSAFYSLSESFSENVFRSGKATFSEFITFIRSIMHECQVKTVQVSDFECFCKSGSWFWSHPNYPTTNQLSLLVKLDENYFLTEPIKSGEMHKIPFKSFLKPFLISLCDCFPSEKQKSILNFDFRSDYFWRLPRNDGIEIDLKLESHPFAFYNCETGYLKQQFSCLKPVDSITFDIRILVGSNVVQIQDEDCCAAEIIQESCPLNPNRTRFYVHSSFSNVGVYELSIYVNTVHVHTIWVKNIRPCTEPPFLRFQIQDCRFIPIFPTKMYTTINEGVALIRFAIAKNRSHYFLKVFKVSSNENLHKSSSPSCSTSYANLVIDGDETRWEALIAVGFHSNGLYRVIVYVNQDDSDSYLFQVQYYFHVNNADASKVVSAHDYVYDDRNYAPIVHPKYYIIPSASTIVLSHLSLTVFVTTPLQSELTYNLFDKAGELVPTSSMTTKVLNDKKIFQISCDFNRRQSYSIKYFDHDNFIFEQFFVFTNYYTRPTKEEFDIRTRFLIRAQNKFNYLNYSCDIVSEDVLPQSKNVYKNGKHLSPLKRAGSLNYSMHPLFTNGLAADSQRSNLPQLLQSFQNPKLVKQKSTSIVPMIQIDKTLNSKSPPLLVKNTEKNSQKPKRRSSAILVLSSNF